MGRYPFRHPTVSFFRQYIAPFLIFVLFLFALVLMSSRSFLPSDLVSPAPVGILPAIAPVSMDLLDWLG